MATDLENNEKLQRFIELLATLNQQIVQVLKTGDASLLVQMNDVVEEMHEIQSKGTEDAYTAIEDQMQIGNISIKPSGKGGLMFVYE